MIKVGVGVIVTFVGGGGGASIITDVRKIIQFSLNPHYTTLMFTLTFISYHQEVYYFPCCCVEPLIVGDKR